MKGIESQIAFRLSRARSEVSEEPYTQDVECLERTGDPVLLHGIAKLHAERATACRQQEFGEDATCLEAKALLASRRKRLAAVPTVKQPPLQMATEGGRNPSSEKSVFDGSAVYAGIHLVGVPETPAQPVKHLERHREAVCDNEGIDRLIPDGQVSTQGGRMLHKSGHSPFA